MRFNELTQHVTEQIITRLEHGAGSWLAPWHTSGALWNPVNAATGGPTTLALVVYSNPVNARLWRGSA